MRLRWFSPRRESGAVLPDPAETARPDPEALQAEINEITHQNLLEPTLESEERLLRLRHAMGIQLMDSASPDPQFAAPGHADLPDRPLPELTPSDLSPELLRAAILRDGCALVRGLVPAEDALTLASEIDRAYRERESDETDPRYYEEFQPDDRFGPVMWRAWIREGGGLLAADSPSLFFQMAEAFGRSGVPGLVAGYLGEPGLLSVHKTTLRKADPSVGGAWHQDGAFMGPVRSVNLWLSLSRCGDEAPGLDILPRRLEQILATGTEGAALTWTISDTEVREAGAGQPIVRPIFEPGDALFFDELFLHRTASDPAMPRPRFAVESWFFGASAFPGDYAPVAV